MQTTNPASESDPLISPTLDLESNVLIESIDDSTLIPQLYTIDNIPQDLQDDLDKSPLTFTRSLIPLDNSLPHTRNLGLYSTIILFIGRMLGSGIMATPGLIFKDCQGSVPLFFITWFIGGMIAYSGLAVYLEYGSLLPVNGATKVFLEFLFPNPKFFTSVVFGLFTVFFNLSSSNALVFGEYIRFAFGYTKDESQTKNLAIALIIFCVILHSSSRKFGLFFQNIIGGIKLFLLLVMVISCIYVIIIPHSITHLPNHITKESWKFPVWDNFSGSLYSKAVLKAIYSFGGWTTAHTVQNEIRNPIKTLSIAGPLSIILIFILYITMNICYLMIIPHDEIMESGQLIGALLFQKLFGNQLGEFLLSLIIAISAAGNVCIVVFADSRLVQEVAKEGILPFNLSEILSSNWPFHNTPFFALSWHGLISILAILIPQKQVYNYIISIQIYPNQLFHAILCLGLLFKLHPRFPNIVAPIKSNVILVYICLIGSLSVIVAPFIQSGGGANKDFGFALVGLTILLISSFIWFIQFVVFPKWRNYTVSIKLRKDEDGVIHKKLIYSPK